MVVRGACIKAGREGAGMGWSGPLAVLEEEGEGEGAAAPRSVCLGKAGAWDA